MAGRDIRHVATSSAGNTFVVAEFERHVQVWNLRTRRRVAAFETTLDFGGRRLAITEEGRDCIVGAYKVFGVASYDIRTGQEIWRRKDLKKVQFVRILKDDDRVYCCLDGSPCYVLDRRSGDTVATLRGVRRVWESGYESLALCDRRALVLERNGDELFKLPRMTFAVLDAAFGPGLLCISESGGPVRCVNTDSGGEIWRYSPPTGIHVLRLIYCEKLATFVALEWAYKHGGTKRLIRLNPTTGECECVAYVGEVAAAGFCRGGAQLITSWGQLWDVKKGTIVESFDFTGGD